VLRLYDYLESGNGKGETRRPEFLRKNPNGRIPVLELDDGTCLAESDAILFYLAEGTPYLPEDRLGRAQVLQWMFFEQYSHEPYIAVLRFWEHSGLARAKAALIPEKTERGVQALMVMEEHLKDRLFFVGERYSIADIALYAYTHVAEEGGFELRGFPAVRAWLERVRTQPRHIPITESRLPFRFPSSSPR
jgi:glutathione S-transferase